MGKLAKTTEGWTVSLNGFDAGAVGNAGGLLGPEHAAVISALLDAPAF